MKPHPRIRKTIKWGGAVVTVLLVVVWGGSGWWDVVWFWSQGRSVAGPASPAAEIVQITLGAGCVYVQHGRFGWNTSVTASTFPGTVTLVSRRSFHMNCPYWWWQFAPVSVDDASPGEIPSFGGAAFTRITSAWNICLWPLAIVSATLAALGFVLDARARRRARVGLCPKCQYDRTGLAIGAVCPECGAGAIGVEDSAARA